MNDIVSNLDLPIGNADGSNVQIPDELEDGPSKRRLSIKTYVLLAAFIIAVVGGYAYYKNNFPSISNRGGSVTEDFQNCGELSYIDQFPVSIELTEKIDDQFEIDNIKLAFSDNQYFSESMGLDPQKIGDYKFSQQLAKAAYITTDVHDGEKYDQVILVDWPTKNTKIIYEELITPFASSHLDITENGISSLTINSESKYLYFSTNSSIYRYSLLDDKLTKLYQDEEISPDHSYGNLYLSPDGNWIIVEVGFYEGGNYKLISTKGGEMISLNRETHSNTFAGWLDNNHILFSTYDDDIGGEKLVSLNIPDLKETVINNNLDIKPTREDSRISLTYNDEKSGQYLCNNVENKYEVKTKILEIGKLDSSRTKQRIIFRLDITDSSGMDKNNEFLGASYIMLNNKEELVVKYGIDYHGKYEVHYLKLSDNPNEVTEILF